MRFTTGQPRRAKSYSILDHQLLHGGYLGRLTHHAMALYLFLCVVGDREGKSYYSDASIGQILRFAGPGLAAARGDLIAEGLIDYQRPYYWVKSLTRPSTARRKPAILSTRPVISRPPPSGTTSPEMTPIGSVIPRGLKELLKTLERNTS